MFYYAFYRGRSLFPSIPIKIISWSKYSHVSMARISGDTVDNVDAWHPDGVRRTTSLLDGHTPNTRVDLFEYVEPLSSMEEDDMWAEALSHLGDGYDWRGVFAHIFHFVRQDPDRWFCSEYAECCASRIRRQLTTKAPDLSTPGALSRSKVIRYARRAM